MIERGRRIPLADRMLVERRAVLNLIDQMRIAIPEQIKRAAELESERDRVLRLAAAEAEELIAAAEARAAQLVSEDAIRREAEVQAAAIIAQAETEAAGIYDQADAYAAGELHSLGRQLNRLQRIVENGISHLQERHQARLQAVADAEAAPEDVPAADPGNGSGPAHSED
ncbi:MAG: hypothetical protein ACOX3S_14640 [Anaerolineae bacterium]|jgi:hypothetical protein